MELRSLTLQPNLTQLLPTLTCCVKPSFQHLHQKELSLKISRRFVAPGQTIEEALSGVKDHAQDLLQVRELLESESWKAAQKTLRQSSALLKKDIYTIIQNKPGIERPPLRKLYSTLFNNVTRLDYAARDKDGPQVWQCYENIVVAVYDILSRI
ncbi:psbQ-like protein 3, chloroplastic isoform X2 [Abrus precatorius]|uniref:PsbQ-like protein 3, chloroplastic isoform X2 n=1 Tax=Abrus precatorius TaxID=3816 RepID=A0A8B8KKU0_ABRPR|nr:psbQ-like protein 3, chloroplastic isoform X2 [Abrus precatorius]